MDDERERDDAAIGAGTESDEGEAYMSAPRFRRTESGERDIWDVVYGERYLLDQRLAGIRTDLRDGLRNVSENMRDMNSRWSEELVRGREIGNENGRSLAALEVAVSGNRDMIRANSEAISALEVAVSGNREEIARNRGMIRANGDAIKINGEAISALKIAVSGNREEIVRNREMILANGEAISALEVAVSGNREEIASNREMIRANGEAISALEVLVSGNREEIASNREAIQGNTAAIASLETSMTKAMSEMHKDLSDKITRREDISDSRSDTRKGWLIQAGVGAAIALISVGAAFIAGLAG